MPQKWYENSYRRNLIDMHIPDWDERFFSGFNAEEYVEMLTLADVDTAYIYATSCVGICNWPTKTGHMHNGLRGRDILGELIQGCYKKGMNVIVYYNIWSKWAYENHPDWRVVSVDGKGTLEYKWTPGRYGVCCFNTPYRDYVISHIKELSNNYGFDGLWIDMILWREVCYCSSCRKRYMEETGMELPKLINWNDPEWIRFLRKREQWVEEFFSNIDIAAKEIKPGITICCNSSYYPDFLQGESLKFYRMGEFVGGDFNMGRIQHSFECKLYNSVTQNKPIEYLGSVMDPALNEHSIMKTNEHLEALMYSTLMNNGRFGFIDAIDPVGTLNRHVYEVMREIFNKEKKYEKYLSTDGEFCQDIAIYTNLESIIDLKDNGKRVIDATQSTPHMESTMNAAKFLIEQHIPFGIATKNDLKDLSKYQVIIISNLYMVDEDEIEAFKKYVREGGNIYASKSSSLITKEGVEKGDFLLSDLLGVSLIGETKEEVTYISPADSSNEFLHYSKKYPLTINSSQMLVKVNGNAEILAKITLPYTHPNDTTKFASAISNPPGIHTEYPAVVLHKYGRGRVLYSSGDIERMEKSDHQRVFVNLIKLLSKEPYHFMSDAPKSVEITMFSQKDRKRYLINLLNFQSELPNIPIDGIKVSVRLNEKGLRLVSIPGEEELEYSLKDGFLEFIAPRLETFLMLMLEYE